MMLIYRISLIRLVLTFLGALSGDDRLSMELMKVFSLEAFGVLWRPARLDLQHFTEPVLLATEASAPVSCLQSLFPSLYHIPPLMMSKESSQFKMFLLFVMICLPLCCLNPEKAATLTLSLAYLGPRVTSGTC